MVKMAAEKPPASASIIPGSKKVISKSKSTAKRIDENDLFDRLQSRRMTSNSYDDDIARLLAELDGQYDPEYKSYDRFV